MKTAHRAFPLIDLLVVVVIIAIFAYAQDYDETYPFPTYTPKSGATGIAKQTLVDLAKRRPRGDKYVGSEGETR